MAEIDPQAIFDKLTDIHTETTVTRTKMEYIEQNLQEQKNDHEALATKVDEVQGHQSYMKGAIAVLFFPLVWLFQHYFRNGA
jgi:hypothetical protein